LAPPGTIKNKTFLKGAFVSKGIIQLVTNHLIGIPPRNASDKFGSFYGQALMSAA
jgi:hypothetical protein